jgi:phosphatidylinositol alpha-1,6-mannosyltransferase
MTAPFRSVLLTPNILGADGVSCLSRQIARTLPSPVMIVSLHDASSRDDRLRRSAGGRRLRFVTDAARTALRCRRDTVIVCAHLHLAPLARLMAWEGARVTYVLCGIEAWIGLRHAERRALQTGRLVAISRHTADRFVEANPQFERSAVDVCHPGIPARAGSVAEKCEHAPSRPAPPAENGSNSQVVPREARLLGAREELLTRAPSGTPAPLSDPAALIVGRLAASEGYKGHELLMAIWPRVLERHPGARLRIVGDGDDRARLEALTARAGVQEAVTFAGRIGDAELDALYEQCRFFVMPSRHEGFGLVFLEAMRAGKACIGAVGAAAEIIEDGVTGLIVDPARAEDLAGAVIRLFDEPHTCEAFGRAGAARFRAEFTDSCFAERFAAVLPQPSAIPPLAVTDRWA